MSLPDIAVVDVETTGFAYKTHDRIVEIGIVRTDFHGKEQARFETLVNPGRDVGPTHIHGITAEMVADAPPFEALSDAVLELLEGTIWIAHNAPFDVNFVSAELHRAGDRIEGVPYHCTLQSTRRIYPDLPSKKLEHVCEFLDIELERAHSALSDATATRHLLQHLRAERPDLLSPSSEPFRVGRPLRGVAAEPVTRDRFEGGREENPSPLKELLVRLPSVETDHRGAEAYASLLDDVLLDRIVTDDELEAVSSLAEDYDISARVAEDIHLEYLKNLIRYALLDGAVTEMEKRDIRKVQGLLALGDRDLEELMEEVRQDLNATYPGGCESVDHSLKGKSVCFTGSLQGKISGEPISRATAQRLARERGMVVKKRVTKKLDYLVAADPHTQSGKAKKARRYDIPVVAELEFWRKLGVEVE